MQPKFEPSLQDSINQILSSLELNSQHILALGEWSARRGLPHDIGVAIALEMEALRRLAELAETLDATDQAKAYAAARIIAGIDWEKQGEEQLVNFEIQQLTQTTERPNDGPNGESGT